MKDEPEPESAALPSPSPEDPPGTARWLDTSFSETKRLRHDGWDGAKMACFCETLAETGVVTEACHAAGMSARSAYSLRHRDPLFEMAWETALSMARTRLADDLLARSLNGTAEQILRDGCIVGERHHFDNKLAFAILRRLDRRAELGATFRNPPAGSVPAPVPALSGEWQPLLDALSDGRTEEATRLLSPTPRKVHEVHNPPIEGVDAVNFDHPRLWRTWDTGEWRTSFPPPPDFDGLEEGEWDDEAYTRELSEAELAALAAVGIARQEEPEKVITIEEDEAERDSFFNGLARLPSLPQAGGEEPRSGEGVGL